MDQFPEGHHVRLRSLELGTYLHAAADGIEVRLDRDRASVYAAWTVHRQQNEHANAYLLLRSAANGRYLAVSGSRAPLGQSGFRVQQREFDEPEEHSITWQVIGHGNFVLLRHVGALFLRANVGGAFHWNIDVTVDNFQHTSTMMRWVVERIPTSQVYPGVPGPINEHFSSYQSVCLLFRRKPPLRVIRFKLANADGTFNEDGWTEFQFRGNSSYRLRYQLILRMDMADFVMCVRAGRYARLTPVLANLPSGTGNPLYIVAIHSPAADELRYPDIAAA